MAPPPPPVPLPPSLHTANIKRQTHSFKNYPEYFETIMQHFSLYVQSIPLCIKHVKRLN